MRGRQPLRGELLAVSPEERYATALHEAGHVLCFVSFPQALRGAAVPRRGRGGLALGYVQYRVPRGYGGEALRRWEMQHALAGGVAERLLRGEGAPSRADRALWAAAWAGIGGDAAGESAALARTEVDVAAFLGRNRQALLMLAGELMEREYMGPVALRAHLGGVCMTPELACPARRPW